MSEIKYEVVEPLIKTVEEPARTGETFIIIQGETEHIDENNYS